MTSHRSGPRRMMTLAMVSLAVTVATAVTGSPASATPAEGEIVATGGAFVPDSFVVVLKDATAGPAGVQAAATGLASQYAGKLGHVYSYALHGFEVGMSEQAAKRLAANPAVRYVQRNGIGTISDSPPPTETQLNPPSWGLDRIDQRRLPLDHSYTYPTRASTVHAYVIDTGIRFSHTTFGFRAVSGWDTVDNDSDASDCNGHGTHVAGTIGGAEYGVAKGVTLAGVRVTDCQGNSSTALAAAGVDWVTAHAIRPAVANMSLLFSADTTLDQAVQNSIASGITYAVAAGNGDIHNNRLNACSFSPARVPQALTVGATQISTLFNGVLYDAAASFSNYGSCVDVLAPGVNITSSWVTNDTATNTISGTSQATPHVTGAAALVLALNPALTPQQVQDQIIHDSTVGVISNLGSGTPNRLLDVPFPGCAGTNNTNVTILANTDVFSNIPISVCGRTPSTVAQIEVHIVHPYIGSLVIDLIAPDGTAYSLKTADLFDFTINLDRTYIRNLSAEAPNGTWRLRVRQNSGNSGVGYIDSWILNLA